MNICAKYFLYDIVAGNFCKANMRTVTEEIEGRQNLKRAQEIAKDEGEKTEDIVVNEDNNKTPVTAKKATNKTNKKENSLLSFTKLQSEFGRALTYAKNNKTQTALAILAPCALTVMYYNRAAIIEMLGKIAKNMGISK